MTASTQPVDTRLGNGIKHVCCRLLVHRLVTVVGFNPYFHKTETRSVLEEEPSRPPKNYVARQY